nr:immunoglobulin heavy chain junction region [Mus musculus]
CTRWGVPDWYFDVW